MTSLPPQAAGLSGEAAHASEAERSTPRTPEAALPAAATSENGGGHRPPARSEPRLSTQPIGAPIELTLDLRGTPPVKVLSRLLSALERVSDDVTLIVLIRDTPEYAGTVSTSYQALRQRGYISDSSRFPPGVQRLRIFRRSAGRNAQRSQQRPHDEVDYVPPPPPVVADDHLPVEHDPGRKSGD